MHGAEEGLQSLVQKKRGGDKLQPYTLRKLALSCRQNRIQPATLVSALIRVDAVGLWSNGGG
jgi:hypothetical protein